METGNSAYNPAGQSTLSSPTPSPTSLFRNEHGLRAGWRLLVYLLLVLGGGVIVMLGLRLFLTPKTVFEDRLPGPLAEGLTHAVFEVTDVDHEIERLRALGTEILIAPVEISAGLGSRRIAFCRSPGGLVFEVMQIRESRV